MTKPNYPKKHKCKICGLELSNYNYTGHFKKHNTTKDDYFKKYRPFIFKHTVKGIPKKEIRTFFNKLDAALTNNPPKDKRSQGQREAREKLRGMSKTLSGTKRIIDLWGIIKTNDWKIITACITVWNNLSVNEINQNIKWLEENTHKAKSPEYMKMYKGEQWYNEYTKNLSERIKGENNPGYHHNGKFSPFSDKFVKYNNKEEFESGKSAARLASKSTKKANPQNESTNLAYWLARYPEDEAKSRYKDRQATFSLDKCIAKHGEENGQMIWQDRQDKWQATLDKKSDEEKANINRKKCGGGACVSKAEKAFVLAIEKSIGFSVATQHTITYANNKSFVYDVQHNNNIIEFFGDFWHANPSIYNSDFVNRVSGKTYAEIHDRDKNRIRLAKESKFNILIVWESEYKSNPKEIIQKCVDFLTRN